MPMAHDPVLRVLYPNAESPGWAHAYEAGWREAEARAKTLGFLYPRGVFHACCESEDTGARFTVLGDAAAAEGDICIPVIEVVRRLLFEDYGIHLA